MQRVRISFHSPFQKLGDSQVSLSPRFKLATAAERSSSSEVEFAQLIPGLPNDVAVNCLLRLPVGALPKCGTVCRSWNQLLGKRVKFFSNRNRLGISSRWLYVLAFDRCTRKIQWQVLNLNLLSWHTIPAMPSGNRLSPTGLQCIALPDRGALLACGGTVSGMDCPVDTVMRFDLQSDRWTTIKRMLNARSFFAGGLINGAVYAAGGSNTNLAELNSAEALNLRTGEWRPVASMNASMVAYDSAVLDGKLLITEGWGWPFDFSPRGMSYDPIANTWKSLAPGLREGWTGASVVLDGRLFVICEYENLKMKFYDAESDSWDIVGGPPVPRKIVLPICVDARENQIYIVGRDLHTVIGILNREDQQVIGERKGRTKTTFSVRWRIHNAPDSMRGLTPSAALVLCG